MQLFKKEIVSGPVLTYQLLRVLLLFNNIWQIHQRLWRGLRQDLLKTKLNILDCNLTTFILTYCDQKDWKHQKLFNLTYPRQTNFIPRVPKNHPTCSNNTHRFHRSFYPCTLFDQWSLTLVLRFWTNWAFLGKTRP